MNNKTYAVRKVKNGYQVVWFWDYNSTGSEWKVPHGLFDNLKDAENYAYDLQYGDFNEY